MSTRAESRPRVLLVHANPFQQVMPVPPYGLERIRTAAADTGAEIEFRSVTRTFGDVVAVRDVSLRVAEGEFVTLLGPSGSGKTTLLMMLAGFLVPTGGDIRINGASVVLRPAHKRDLGIVFQHYALFPHLSVFDNVAFPLRLRRMSVGGIRHCGSRYAVSIRSGSRFGKRRRRAPALHNSPHVFEPHRRRATRLTADHRP